MQSRSHSPENQEQSAKKLLRQAARERTGRLKRMGRT